MLDAVLVFHAGGLVLWSKYFYSISKKNQYNPIDHLISEVLLKGRDYAGSIGETGDNVGNGIPITIDSHSIQYIRDNDNNLIFAFVYQKVLSNDYVPELMASTKDLFLITFAANLKLETLVPVSVDKSFFAVFEKQFDALHRQTEDRYSAKSTSLNPKKKLQSSTAQQSSLPASKQKQSHKKDRKWDDKVSAKDFSDLDYSSSTKEKDNSNQQDGDFNNMAKSLVDASNVGTEIKEFEETGPNASKASHEKDNNRLFSMFKNVISGQKVLNDENLKPVVQRMKDQLVHKNVASDVADRICTLVLERLRGKTVGTFTRVESLFKESLEGAIEQILTPKVSVNLINDIESVIRSEKRPFVFLFVGVNGVGKSTNLSKICFWLLQNKFKLLVAACDTFRSGAVEQLGVHVRNLKQLNENATIDLFQRGYGKDAAAIAKEAIVHGKSNKYDIVLIDTAGRMQDNEPLMRALAKLVNVNQPDKIVFVGEALVGNEAVDQLSKFNQALCSFSDRPNNPRTIDGIVLTKFDTIDDKVGAALSMTYTSGAPILFLGTGQTYTDLKRINIPLVVKALLKD